MRKSAKAPIDLDFRPATYFWPLGLEKHLLARIKGAERRAALKRLIKERRLDDIPALLAQSALSEADRVALGRIHPALMGGEYLPDMEEQEIEVARVTIASVTQDVTSVYARRGEGCIHYRVVDEYGGDTLTACDERTSAQPLTLGELVDFLNGAWSIFEVLDMNFEGGDVDDMLGFVVGVDSEFYPEFGGLYTQRLRDWAAARQEDSADDED